MWPFHIGTNLSKSQCLAHNFAFTSAMKPWFECVILSDNCKQNSALQSCASPHNCTSQSTPLAQGTALCSKAASCFSTCAALCHKRGVHLIKALICTLYCLQLPHQTFSIHSQNAELAICTSHKPWLSIFSTPNTKFPIGVRTFEQKFIINVV